MYSAPCFRVKLIPSSFQPPCAATRGIPQLKQSEHEPDSVETDLAGNVTWAPNVIDNEHLQRKSSKGECAGLSRTLLPLPTSDLSHHICCRPTTHAKIACCIFHKKRAFGESDSDESDSDWEGFGDEESGVGRGGAKEGRSGARDSRAEVLQKAPAASSRPTST